MKNKKINLIKLGLIFAFVSLSATVIRADIITTTIPYVDDNGVKSVNIEDLTRALKGKVIENESSIDIFLNDSILSIYPESGSAFFDGDLIPLKTKKIKDETTGEEFEFPMCQKITENYGGHLIPVSLISKYFGVEGENEGYIIKTEIKNTNDDTITNNSNDSSDNKNIGSNTVSTETANNNESSNTENEYDSENNNDEDNNENNNDNEFNENIDNDSNENNEVE
ncbi:MAG: hypothetical protein SOY42_01235 [Clostridium sp.]|nr:hypothetical protein [Clostridium sp.]